MKDILKTVQAIIMANNPSFRMAAAIVQSAIDRNLDPVRSELTVVA